MQFESRDYRGGNCGVIVCLFICTTVTNDDDIHDNDKKKKKKRKLCRSIVEKKYIYMKETKINWRVVCRQIFYVDIKLIYKVTLCLLIMAIAERGRRSKL